MPLKDKDARLAYQRAWKAAWRKANPEKRAAEERAYRKAHPDKANAKKARWIERHPELAKASTARRTARYYVKNRHGLKLNQRIYRENLPEEVKQTERDKTAAYRSRVSLAGRPKPDLCEACGKSPDARGLVFDHCHAKGHFRGWLCQRCNTALGMVGDDAQTLLKLAAYLERNREHTSPQLALIGI